MGNKISEWNPDPLFVWNMIEIANLIMYVVVVGSGGALARGVGVEGAPPPPFLPSFLSRVAFVRGCHCH